MYQDNLRTESEGMKIITDFFSAKTGIPPRPIENKYAQKLLGDLVIIGKTAKFAEVKVESHFTGNLFLETASNAEYLGLPGKGDSALGWIFTCQSDLLIYLFLDSDQLFTVSMPALRNWLLNQTNGTLRSFKEVKAKQTGANDSWGRLCPIETLRAAQLDGWYEAKPLQYLSQQLTTNN